MTYFIIGVIITAIVFIMLNKMRNNNLVDKERELEVKLKEQERITSESEASYEDAKNKFRGIANTYKQPSPGNEHSKL